MVRNHRPRRARHERPRHDQPSISRGNFAPVRSEDDFADLQVTGEIPRAACAAPSTATAPTRNSSRATRPPLVRRRRHDPRLLRRGRQGLATATATCARRNGSWSTRRGQSLFGTFGNPLTTDPSVIGKDGGVANTNIVWHAGKLLALEEGHQPFELDPETLEPRGYLDYAGRGNALHRASQARPRNRRDGVLRLFGRRHAASAAT